MKKPILLIVEGTENPLNKFCLIYNKKQIKQKKLLFKKPYITYDVYLINKAVEIDNLFS